MSIRHRSWVAALVMTGSVAVIPLALNGAQKTDAAARKTSGSTRSSRRRWPTWSRRQQMAQRMVDQIFSYGELGFQEIETNRYLIDLLKTNGFSVQEGIAGIPTAFLATWGSGKPVIALGSDIDCIPAGVAEARRGVSRSDD